MFKDLFMSEFSGESDLIDMDTGIGKQKRLYFFSQFSWWMKK